MVTTTTESLITAEEFARLVEYHAAGVQVVGVLDPEAEFLYMFEADAPPRILGPGDDLTLPAMLGDFRVSISTLLE